MRIAPSARIPHGEALPGPYSPCPCGKESLAQMTDHSCELCEETYKLCYRCANPEVNW